MAHRQQQDFCESVRQRFPDHFRDSFVLDVGSFDVNGNNRVLFENCNYLGVDLAPGRNVDICSAGHELGLPDATFDTVISTECAEHDRHFAETLRNMTRMLKPGGLLVFTCATTGRPEHGTRRTTPGDAPPLMSAGDWADYYRNVTEDDFRNAVDVERTFSSFEFSTNDETKDLYFWGTRAGVRTIRQDYSFLLPSRREADVASELQSMALFSKLVDFERRVDELGAALASANAITTRHEQALIAHEIQATSLRRYVQELGSRTQDIEESQKARRTGLGRFFESVRQRVTGSTTCSPSTRKVSLNLFLYEQIYVLTPKHTTFVARLIVEALAAVGVKAQIIHQKPEQGFADSPHFVIAPQVFEELPGFYVAFQMEQSVSPRWFNKQYFDTLEKAFAIFDYSVDNIAYLTTNGLHAKQIYYMPLNCISEYQAAFDERLEQPVDVLFYGDINCPRRVELIEALAEHFEVDIVSEVYGEELYRRIARARVIVNIHYYSDALLETTRLFECLSLGKLIVSEAGADQRRHSDLHNVVDFVGVGDSEGMIAAIARLLEDEPYRQSRLKDVRAFNSEPRKPFVFHFMRFLLGVDEISFDQFYALAGHHFAFGSDRICLGLPEYRKRQESFEEANEFGFEMFPGLRHASGWIGCGMSYKFIMLKAREQGFGRVTVCEDDVEFLPGWDVRFDKIIQHLDNNDDWDIFAGLIADLHPETKVSGVTDAADGKLASINKMVSTVLNVYGHRAFEVLARWSPSNSDATTNTIDRFIEAQGGLRFVTAYPFLVGHRDDLTSTLWEFQNSQYNPMIERSLKVLSDKISAFEDRTQLSTSTRGVLEHNNVPDVDVGDPLKAAE